MGDDSDRMKQKNRRLERKLRRRRHRSRDRYCSDDSELSSTSLCRRSPLHYQGMFLFSRTIYETNV